MDFREIKEARKKLAGEIVQFAWDNPSISQRDIAAKYGVTQAWVCILCKRAGYNRKQAQQ